VIVDLHNYEGFATVKQDTTFEGKMVYFYCTMNDVPLIRLNFKDKCPDTHIPCGSVQWCLHNLGVDIKPNYYPDWLKDHLHRKVWESNEWILGEKLFVKPSDKQKRFTGFITHGTYRKKKKRPYWYSEVVTFTNEWRYYVTNGKILCGEWYDGDEVNTPDAPELNISIPTSFSGTIDFGTLPDGTLALVEAHEPFACGWYGDKEDYTYLQWIVDGWIHARLHKKEC